MGHYKSWSANKLATFGSSIHCTFFVAKSYILVANLVLSPIFHFSLLNHSFSLKIFLFMRRFSQVPVLQSLTLMHLCDSFGARQVICSTWRFSDVTSYVCTRSSKDEDPSQKFSQLKNEYRDKRAVSSSTYVYPKCLNKSWHEFNQKQRICYFVELFSKS